MELPADTAKNKRLSRNLDYIIYALHRYLQIEKQRHVLCNSHYIFRLTFQKCFVILPNTGYLFLLQINTKISSSCKWLKQKNTTMALYYTQSTMMVLSHTALKLTSLLLINFCLTIYLQIYF